MGLCLGGGVRGVEGMCQGCVKMASRVCKKFVKGMSGVRKEACNGCVWGV